MIDYLMPEARAWKNKDPAQEGGTRGRRVLQISRHFAGDGIAEQHVSKVERKLRFSDCLKCKCVFACLLNHT